MAPEADERELILREAKESLARFERDNPQLTGPTGQAATQSTPVTVTEDDGVLTAGWRKLRQAASAVGEKAEAATDAVVGWVGETVGAATKKALTPDPARQSRSAELRAAAEGTLAEQAAAPLAERDIARQFQETGAEVTRTGAEKVTRLAVETAEAELGVKTAVIAGSFLRSATGLRRSGEMVYDSAAGQFRSSTTGRFVSRFEVDAANAGATLPRREIANFIGKPNRVLLEEGEVLYGIRERGSRRVWWARVKPKGELQWRMDQAVLPEWNRATHIEAMTVPKGGKLVGFEGPARGQGPYIGGGNQIYIPDAPPEWSRLQPWKQ